MQLKKLKVFVKQGEGETLEFKETTGRLTDSMRTICAFLNQEGGTILFGVSDKGKIIGQEISDKTSRDIANELTKINPQADVKVGKFNRDTIATYRDINHDMKGYPTIWEC